MADKKIATREAYGETLAELGETNRDIVVLDADLSCTTRTEYFAKKFPERFMNCGIAEANMMCVAAGLAAAGKIPFASTFAMFATGRVYDQIRNSIAYPGLNVKIAATHAGLTVGEDGASHQCNEDIALMRAIPGMTIINPSDAIEAREAVKAAVAFNGPMYLRFGRAEVPVINNRPDYKFELGKGTLLAPGADVAIIATGVPLGFAIEAQAVLASEGIFARLINIHTIKPIDRDIIIAAASECRAIVTVEEHNIIGGLGSAVTEVVCETRPVPVLRVGVKDTFGCSGSAFELLEHFGISTTEIVKTAKAAIKLK